MLKRIAVLFCAISTMATAQTGQAPQQTLVPVSGFPTGPFLNSLQDWLDLIQPIRFEVTTPASPIPPTINLAAGADGGCAVLWCSTNDTIWAPVTTPASANENWAGVDYQGFTHEMMHQSLPLGVLDGVDDGLHEGLANGKTDLIYLTLRNVNPSLFPPNTQQPSITEAPVVDTYNNRRLVVYGGAANSDGSSDFYDNFDNSFDSPASLLGIAINKLGGDHRQLDAAINASIPRTRADFLTLLDKTSPLIDGVRPSTFMRYDVTNFAGAPAGTYFGIRNGNGYDPIYKTVGSDHWPFNPAEYVPAFVQFTAGSTPAIIPTWLNNSFAPTSSVPMAWSIHDPIGSLMTSRTTDAASRIPPMAFSEVNSDGTFGSSFSQTFPEAAYLINACITGATNSANCKTGPEMNDSDVFAMLNGEELSPGDVGVIANGPQWGQLSTNVDLTLTSPLGTTVEKYPGLYIYRNLPQNPDGTFQDVTVTDGKYIRTFTPDKFAPTLRYFKRRDEPIFQALTRSTDYQVPKVIVPGAIYSIFGWGLTQNDPWAASQFPLTTEGSAGTMTNDQGRTEVLFTLKDGTQYKGRFLYVSQLQLNVVAPSELATHIGEPVTVTVVLNGTVSMQSKQFTVGASDPTVYMIGSTGTAAAVFATPAIKAGQIVTTTNSVSAGDIISVFGTGLGPKMMTPSNPGMPMDVADSAIASISVTVGGKSAQVLYAGCAPGYVGLDQINLVVPEGVAAPSGSANLIIITGVISSSPTSLPMAQ